MKSGITKRVLWLAILCVLVMAFAVPAASAASYSKVYGKTQDRVRVRESASTNGAIIDNIVKNACVYVTSSKTSGGNTFIQVKYRASTGDIESGWICQSDGKETYVKILSNAQAKSEFSVSGGNLPSKKVGTFTAAQRKASTNDSDTTYIREGTSSEAVKSVQTKLKALKYYTGDITGNAGNKTVAAIKKFQSDHNLTADGIAGPQTIAKIDAAYAASGSSSGASSSGSSSSSGLKLGSSGTSVRNLQQDLTTLGYYWAEITGNFGEKTETAVKKFQAANGLTSDGVAGSKTLAAIASAVAKKGGSSSSSGSSTSTGGNTLKLNSQGTKVAQLQENLKQLGYYYADITGNFGEKTEAAVKKFQSAHNLSADGVAGSRTLTAIAAAVEEAGGSSGGSSGTTTGLKLGSTGTEVSNLQTDLTTLGYYYGDITGRYGSLTQQAVKKFQKARGLPQDGVAGTTTINAIASALKNSGSSSASGGTSSTALREGDSGTAVTELQTMLKSLGYYYGDITGSFGSLTRRAVRAFQDANGMSVDGVAGAATLNKLRTLTGGSSGESSSSGATVSTANSYGRITKDNVYLRSSYSTTSSAKASLKKGTLMRISKTYTVGGIRWYYVTVKVGSYTYKGYIRSDMMETITETEYNSGGGSSSDGDQEVLGMIRVTANNVSLRYEPSTNATRVGTANTGDCFYYVDTVSGWFQTQSGYWISSSYAKVMTQQEVNDYIGNASSTSYKYGSTGSQVLYIQEALKSLGYYAAELTGNFGGKTETAVKNFQRDHGLTADGVVGATTMAEIMKAYSGSSDVTITIGATVYNLNWFTAKQNGVFSKIGIASGKSATLTDLTTGRSINIHIQSAGNHVDAEPLTAADTTTLCSIYGVSSASNISYVRRPMLLTTSTGHQIVCSIYGTPHGAQDITNNNYPGQFCLHFLNSRTHGSDSVNGDHQEAIKSASTLVTRQGATVVELNNL